MTRRGQAGVTLMELLIAVSLVSALATGMLLAIRVGLNAMDKTNSRFIANRKVISVEKIIESQIGGLIPVVANCAAASNARFLFFEGKPQSLHFVSSYSLQEGARGYPRILAFSVVNAPQGVRLIVNETVYPGPVGAGMMCAGLANGVPSFNDSEANPRSFVLADKLAYCRFLYRKSPQAPQPEAWLPEWTGAEILPYGFLPTAIRVEMAPLEPNPATLQLLTITTPLRITKWGLGPYADD